MGTLPAGDISMSPSPKTLPAPPPPGWLFWGVSSSRPPSWGYQSVPKPRDPPRPPPAPGILRCHQPQALQLGILGCPQCWGTPHIPPARYIRVSPAPGPPSWGYWCVPSPAEPSRSPQLGILRCSQDWEPQYQDPQAEYIKALQYRAPPPPKGVYRGPPSMAIPPPRKLGVSGHPVWAPP